jgi:hypothetical protein
MKFLENYSEWYPNEEEVKKCEEYLDENYKRFTDTEFGKMILVDDKSYFLNNKSELTDRIYYDVINKDINFSKSSLRKAIKNWIDRNK